jgi:hypothetical protein
MTVVASVSKKLTTARRLVQFAIMLGGLVPVGAGLSGVLLGPAMIDATHMLPIPLDSHYRYLSGLLLAIGLAYWSTIYHIEKRTERFQLLTFLVVVGGFSRIVSLWAAGLPDKPMLFGLAMELVITPLLALAQFYLAKAYARYRLSLH